MLTSSHTTHLTTAIFTVSRSIASRRIWWIALRTIPALFSVCLPLSLSRSLALGLVLAPYLRPSTWQRKGGPRKDQTLGGGEPGSDGGGRVPGEGGVQDAGGCQPRPGAGPRPRKGFGERFGAGDKKTADRTMKNWLLFCFVWCFDGAVLLSQHVDGSRDLPTARLPPVCGLINMRGECSCKLRRFAFFFFFRWCKRLFGQVALFVLFCCSVAWSIKYLSALCLLLYSWRSALCRCLCMCLISSRVCVCAYLRSSLPPCLPCWLFSCDLFPTRPQ